MDIREFSSLLAVYGGRLDKWPHTYRLPAMRLLDQSPDAFAMLEQARMLESALQVEEPPTSPGRLRALEDSILAGLDLEEEEAPKPAPRIPARPRRPSAAPGGRKALWAGLRPGRLLPRQSGQSAAQFLIGGVTGFGLSMILLAGVGLWAGTHLGQISSYSQQQVLAYYSIDLWLR